MPLAGRGFQLEEAIALEAESVELQRCPLLEGDFNDSLIRCITIFASFNGAPCWKGISTLHSERGTMPASASTVPLAGRGFQRIPIKSETTGIQLQRCPLLEGDFNFKYHPDLGGDTELQRCPLLEGDFNVTQKEILTGTLCFNGAPCWKGISTTIEAVDPDNY